MTPAQLDAFTRALGALPPGPPWTLVAGPSYVHAVRPNAARPVCGIALLTRPLPPTPVAGPDAAAPLTTCPLCRDALYAAALPRPTRPAPWRTATSRTDGCVHALQPRDPAPVCGTPAPVGAFRVHPDATDARDHVTCPACRAHLPMSDAPALPPACTCLPCPSCPTSTTGTPPRVLCGLCGYCTRDGGHHPDCPGCPAPDCPPS